VTQIAEVEVKRASIRDIRPELVVAGIDRIAVPAMIASKKLRAKSLGGWISFFLKLFNFPSYKPLIKQLLWLPVKSESN